MNDSDADRKVEAIRPDPLIDEVREIRRRIVEEAGGTVDGLYEYLKRVEAQYADRLVKPKASESPSKSAE